MVYPDALPAWEQIPRMSELEGVFRRTATGKSFFDDQVPGDLLHHGASQLAKTLFPLLLKQLALKQEPILFKGGLLAAAYKRGDPAITANYRSLLISPTIGKSFHRLLRRDLMCHFNQSALPLQLGGRPGISVTQAAQALQVFLSDQREAGLSTAVIFLDIKNAFYQLFREQLVKSTESAHTLQTLFALLNLPGEAFAEFQRLMSQGTALEDSDVPLYLHTQVRELLNSTWFVVPGSSKLTKARKGSRPGDSAADLLFTVAFKHLLARVQDRAEDLGMTSIPWSGEREPYSDELSQTFTVSLLGPVWADDLAVLLRHDRADQLVENVRQVTAHLFDVLTIAGMTPNLAKSKTEVYVVFRGPGSVQVRRQLAEQDWQLAHPSVWHPEPIRLVGSYRHLGSWIQVGGKLCKELNCRFGVAHTTFSQYRGAIFANSALSLRKKVQLFESLILSYSTLRRG